jgi:hypothetical protein
LDIIIKNLSEYILEVKADNGEPWLVYVDNKLDDTFTEYAKTGIGKIQDNVLKI